MPMRVWGDTYRSTLCPTTCSIDDMQIASENTTDMAGYWAGRVRMNDSDSQKKKNVEQTAEFFKLLF